MVPGSSQSAAHVSLRTKNGRLAAATLAAILLVHTLLLAWSGYRHSPVSTEVPHLPAGISHWRFARFDLFRVNPPLVRMIAALPVMLADPQTNWTNYSTNPLVRTEAAVGIDFVAANKERTFWLFTLGRWACIPFSLLGAYVCYCWARELYGAASGLAGAALWCFCPNILGNASLMMPDVPAAALGAAACYTFWRWLKEPTWIRTVTAGALLGLAELTKTTLVIFYPLWPALWLVYRFRERHRMTVQDWLREATMIAARILIAIYILNLGYGFEGTGKRLGEYRFQSRVLTGETTDQDRLAAGNRFTNSWLGALPVLLPKNYVQGIDSQKLDFERGLRSYLGGKWSDRGWWYFYLYAMALKIPLGTWALVGLAALATLRPGDRSTSPGDEMILLVSFAVILLLVSSQTGFSIHFRYVLPAFPFLFIWTSKAMLLISRSRALLASLTTAALLWSIGSSLSQYPHSLSYFNELAGGPEHGHEHLLESSIAWGQDLLYLKRWRDAHPEARPFYLAAANSVDPKFAGLDYVDLRSGAVPEAGWLVIDVNRLMADDNFARFRAMAPVARIGGSYRIYHSPVTQANRPLADGS